MQLKIGTKYELDDLEFTNVHCRIQPELGYKVEHRRKRKQKDLGHQLHTRIKFQTFVPVGGTQTRSFSHLPEDQIVSSCQYRRRYVIFLHSLTRPPK